MQQDNKFGDFALNLMKDKIVNMKMTNFYPESRDMTISAKGSCQEVVKLHLYCHDFKNTGPKSIKVLFSDSSCYELSKNINFT